MYTVHNTGKNYYSLILKHLLKLLLHQQADNAALVPGELSGCLKLSAVVPSELTGRVKLTLIRLSNGHFLVFLILSGPASTADSAVKKTNSVVSSPQANYTD
jgi:hypothetical protein